MSSTSVWCFCLLWITSFSAVELRPKCTTHGGKDVVCKPGKSDYVLKRGLVSDNNRTTGITLKGCRISDVDFESFENLSALKYLDLSVNKIATLKLGVLDDAVQVTYLNLSYNLLKDFELGLFDQKTNLEILDLRGNRINNIVLGVFDPLVKLRHLDLSYNKIVGSKLSPYIFDQNTNIKFLDFSRNDMSGTSDNQLQGLNTDTLYLDRCFLKEVPIFATADNLGSMTKLIMSTNQIKSIDNPTTFVNLITLEEIDLTANEIDKLHKNVFKPLKNIRIIHLRYNMLMSLADSQFQNMNKLRRLDLSHNKLESIPVNSFRGTSLELLNLSDNRFTYLQDNFYLELRNSGVRIRKFFFNDNPWQCACLRDLLKEMKHYRVEYNSAKYDGKNRVCVTSAEFSCKRHHSDNVYYNELYYDLN